MKSSSFRNLMVVTVTVALAGCAGNAGTQDQAQTTPMSVDRFHIWPGPVLTPIVMRPPLHERAVTNLAVVYDAERILDFEHIGWFTIGSEHVQVSSDPWIDPAFAESRLLELAQDRAVVNVQSYTLTHGAIADDLKQTFWTERYYFGEPAKELFEDLRNNGVDGILLIMEGPLRDTLGAPVLRGAKGLYSASTIYVYAGFLAILVDPATGKIMRNGMYQQVSATYLPELEWKEGGFESYSPQEKALIVEEIKERIRNNVKQILLLFKIIPIRDNEFMVVEDLDRSEIAVFEYPE